MKGQELINVGEADLAAMMQGLASACLHQEQAAPRLGLSVQQVKRLLQPCERRAVGRETLCRWMAGASL